MAWQVCIQYISNLCSKVWLPGYDWIENVHDVPAVFIMYATHTLVQVPTDLESQGKPGKINGQGKYDLFYSIHLFIPYLTCWSCKGIWLVDHIKVFNMFIMQRYLIYWSSKGILTCWSCEGICHVDHVKIFAMLII